MAKINNSEVIQKLTDELKLYPGKDIIPSELAEKILPVFQINSDEVKVKNPASTIVRSEQETLGSSTTIYTVPANGKFYLTNAYLTSYAHGAAFSLGVLTVTIDGTDQDLLSLRGTGVDNTPGAPSSISYNLQNPVLLDPGTNIVLTSSSGEFEVTGGIVGYIE